ncbi:MAG: C25 family cysteine peptidase [Desulfurococcales archaeon]|nr:C25 family cysteine peptidase [Desulfurococcales archaeon]
MGEYDKIKLMLLLSIIILNIIQPVLAQQSSSTAQPESPTMIRKKWQITVDPNSLGYSIVEGSHGSQYITVKGLKLALQPGYPPTPQYVTYYVLPENTENLSVLCEVGEPITVNLTGSVERVRPPQPLLPGKFNGTIGVDMPAITFPYPSKPCEYWLGHYPGGLLLGVRVYPVKYTGINQAIIYSVTLQVEADVPVDEKVFLPAWLALSVDPTHVISNDWPPVVDNIRTIVLLLGNDSFLEPLRPYIIARTAMGYNVLVYNISYVNSSYSGDSLADKIRAFARDMAFNQGADYLLLVGDADLIPPAYFYAEDDWSAYGEDYYKATDHYYAWLDGNWDPDGDGKLLEQEDHNGNNYPEVNVEPIPDVVPDIIVGRIPVDTPSDLRGVVSNILSWEEGGTNGTLLSMAAILNYENENNLGWDKTDGAAPHVYLIQHDLPSSPYPVQGYYRLYERGGLSPSTYESDMALTWENATAMLREAPSYILSGGHGSQYEQARKVWSSDDGDGVPESGEMSWYAFISRDGIPETHAGGIQYNDGCLTGFYDYSFYQTYAEESLRKMASAVIASSRISYYMVGWTEPGGLWDQEFEYFFWRELLSGDYPTVGDAFFASQLIYNNSHDVNIDYASKKDVLIHNLLGDPVLRPWVPPKSVLSFQLGIESDGNEIVFTVNNNSGEPVPNTLVSIIMPNGSVVARGYTGYDGVITLSAPSEAGKYYVTVFRADYPLLIKQITFPIIEVPPHVEAHIIGGDLQWEPGRTADIIVYFTYNNTVVEPQLSINATPPESLTGVETLEVGGSKLYIAHVKLEEPGNVILGVHAEYENTTTEEYALIRFTHQPVNKTVALSYYTGLYEAINTLTSNITATASSISEVLRQLQNRVNTSIHILLEIQGDTSQILDLSNMSLTQVNTSYLDIRENQYRIIGNILLINSSKIGPIIAELNKIADTIESVNKTVINISTVLGAIICKLDNIQASIVRVGNGTITLNTSIGELMILVEHKHDIINNSLKYIKENNSIIMSDISMLSPVIAAVRGRVAIIQTSLGNITSNVNYIKELINESNSIVLNVTNNTMLITTAVGNIAVNSSLLKLKIINIYNNTVILDTNIGELRINIDKILGELTHINATMLDLKNKVLSMHTRIGIIQASLLQLNASIYQVTDNTIILQTSLGKIRLKLNRTSELISILNSLKSAQQTQKTPITSNETLPAMNSTSTGQTEKTESTGRRGLLMIFAAIVVIMSVLFGYALLSRYKQLYMI